LLARRLLKGEILSQSSIIREVLSFLVFQRTRTIRDRAWLDYLQSSNITSCGPAEGENGITATFHRKIRMMLEMSEKYASLALVWLGFTSGYLASLAASCSHNIGRSFRSGNNKSLKA
jgi:hypothetical protein